MPGVTGQAGRLQRQDESPEYPEAAPVTAAPSLPAPLRTTPCPSQKFLECNELETGTVLFLNFAYNILERIFESEKPISTGLRGAVIYTTAPTRE